MEIQTSRFGAVRADEEDFIFFPEGLLGFSDLNRFILLDDPSDEIFVWLQSCDSAAIAFPVLEPELLSNNYSVDLAKSDLEALGLKVAEGLRYFTIITIPEDPTQMTANLKAPVVINVKDRKARQCVLQDNSLAIREPIFSTLQQRVVQNPEVSIKPSSSDWGVAIQLPDLKPQELEG